MKNIDTNRKSVKAPDERSRVTAFLVFSVANVVMAILFAVTFHQYYGSIKESQNEKNISAIESYVETQTNTISSSVLTFSSITSSYASYIEAQTLSLADTKNYLLHWGDFYKAVAIVNTSVYQAHVLVPGTGTYLTMDFGSYPWATNVCDHYDEPVPIRVTDVFLDYDNTTYDVAFYAPCRIGAIQYVLMFFMDSNALEGSMTVKGLNTTHGLILDGDGKIMRGSLGKMSDAVGINYYEYIDSIGAGVTSETLKDELAQNGSFLFYSNGDTSESETLTIAKSVPFTDSWTYVYEAKPEEYNTDSNLYNMAFFVKVYVAVWLLVVILTFHYYRNKLSQAFKIVRRQNEELAYASQAKTLFVSNISHELRTPINAVLGLNEMILQDTTEPVIKEYAYDIRSAGKALLSVINEVLDFSKIESGHMEIVPSKYSVVELVKDTYTLISLKAEQKDLRLFINVSPNIPTILIGDEVRIRQILVNLLTNAVKYTDRGSVTLRIDCESTAPDKINLLVSVKDTGIGLKPDELDKLFEEFSRLDIQKNHKTEGTGLGLPLVKKLLELMNSRLQVESVYGSGSTFSFSLPQDVSDSAPIGGLNLTDKSEARGIAANTDKVKVATNRILVVDDNRMNLKVFTGLLRDTSLQIDTCDSGLRALTMCDGVKYDLIFLDHKMPEMDGVETLHRLRDTSLFNKETPVVALTANVVSGAKEMYVSEGFVDFLSKPINIAYLNEMLEEQLHL